MLSLLIHGLQFSNAATTQMQPPAKSVLQQGAQIAFFSENTFLLLTDSCQWTSPEVRSALNAKKNDASTPRADWPKGQVIILALIRFAQITLQDVANALTNDALKKARTEYNKKVQQINGKPDSYLPPMHGLKTRERISLQVFSLALNGSFRNMFQYGSQIMAVFSCLVLRPDSLEPNIAEKWVIEVVPFLGRAINKIFSTIIISGSSVTVYQRFRLLGMSNIFAQVTYVLNRMIWVSTENMVARRVAKYISMVGIFVDEILKLTFRLSFSMLREIFISSNQAVNRLLLIAAHIVEDVSGPSLTSKLLEISSPLLRAVVHISTFADINLKKENSSWDILGSPNGVAPGKGWKCVNLANGEKDKNNCTENGW